jgi:hypothetical protein
MSKAYCSPKKYLAKGDTCLSKSELQLIAEDYNNTVSDMNIKISTKQSKKKLYESLRSALQKYCESDNDEHCWIEQDFINNNHKSQLNSSFRPKKPKQWYKNKYTWLNTFDILNVMKQYEQSHKSFRFLGVYPIDFQDTYPDGTCIGNMLCSIHIRQLKKMGKKQFAMVLNLDKHNQSGSHWVSVFCNIDPKKENFGIYYYDSVAVPPGRQVSAFMQQIKEQVKEIFPQSVSSKFKVEYNTIQKQFENSECGVFSMVFTTQMLREHQFSYICEHMKQDSGINEIRDVLYRPSLFVKAHKDFNT